MSRWRGLREPTDAEMAELYQAGEHGPLMPDRPRWDQVYDLIQLSRTHPHLAPAEVRDLWVGLRAAQR